VNRIDVDPGLWSTPLHVEGSEEEIFYVLAGSGVSVQYDDETLEAFDVTAGDCLVHLPLEHAHTLRAGPDGLDVLAFGERHFPMGSTRLPRAGMAWGLGSWAPTGRPEDHPWTKESEAGAPDVPEVSPRPERIVALAAVDAETNEHGDIHGVWRNLGVAAGSRRTGLRHVTVPSGLLGVAPHCHSAEHEIFVVLAGSGTLELIPSPRAASAGAEPESFPVTAGSTVNRPPGTRIAHTFRAGPDGLEYLAYSTRDPSDIAYYPRSNKINIRGVGLIGRVEPLDYWDGEDGEKESPGPR
jgi:uncharacterized cupin superfamily protein